MPLRGGGSTPNATPPLVEDKDGGTLVYRPDQQTVTWQMNSSEICLGFIELKILPKRAFKLSEQLYVTNNIYA